MALEARSRVRVGRREYFRGERLTPEDEAEMRRRPGFTLLLEEGYLVEVKEPPKVPSPPPVDPVISALDQMLGVASSPSDQTEPQGEPDGFPCPHCDYVAKKEMGLKVHLGREHKEKARTKRRKR